MPSFDMSDYIDVAERIRQFAEKFPEGSLQSEVEFVNEGVLCKAYAFRTPDDPRPGIGHAFEPIPGKTPYTRDSETMNAETSAWGRAIVALGFETKKIASAEEVRARQVGADPGRSTAPAVADEAAASAPSAFKAPEGPRGSKASELELKARHDELIDLVKKLGADDSIPTIHEHAAAGDLGWLERQIITATKHLAERV